MMLCSRISEVLVGESGLLDGNSKGLFVKAFEAKKNDAGLYSRSPSLEPQLIDRTNNLDARCIFPCDVKKVDSQIDSTEIFFGPLLRHQRRFSNAHSSCLQVLGALV